MSENPINNTNKHQHKTTRTERKKSINILCSFIIFPQPNNTHQIKKATYQHNCSLLWIKFQKVFFPFSFQSSTVCAFNISHYVFHIKLFCNENCLWNETKEKYFFLIFCVVWTKRKYEEWGILFTMQKEGKKWSDLSTFESYFLRKRNCGT